jgi:4'-phosphopantetheinyl transferase
VSLPASLPRPGRYELHVWHVTVDDATLAGGHALLDDAETTRAARFVFAKDRDQFVAARSWLRRLLGAYLGRVPATLRFQYGTEGKPALLASGVMEEMALRFNVSHSHDQVLLAFALGRDVGVDVEQIEARVNCTELASTCFSSDEQRAYHSAPEHRQLNAFFRYWTAKEAYIKALGGGLSIPLQEFTVDIVPGATRWPVRTATSRKPAYTVSAVDVPAGYAAAIAAEGEDWRVILREVVSTGS